MSISAVHARAFSEPSSTTTQPNLALLNVGFLVLLVFGIHTGVSLPFLPHEFLAFIAACGIYLVNSRKITARLMVWFVVVFVVMSSVGLIISLSSDVPFGSELRAMTNFTYDIFTGLGVYFGVMRLGRTRTSKLFWILFVVLVIGSVLELMGPAKPLSDWFRRTVRTHSVYEQDERDVSQYGGIRPKFFASEPSLLGVSISISFYLWFSSLQRPRRKQYVAALLLLVVALVVVRSPVIAFGVIAYLLTLCVTTPARGRWTPRLRSLATPVYAAFSLFIPGLLLSVQGMQGVPTYLTASSMFSREIAPYYMAVRSIQTHPLFGIGLQDDDQLKNLALGVYTMPGRESKVSAEALDSLGSNSCNAFWFTFISFGICGTAILAFMIMRLLKLLKVPVSFWAVSAIVCFTYWMALSRVTTPMAWFMYFAVAASCTLRMSQVSV